MGNPFVFYIFEDVFSPFAVTIKIEILAKIVYVYSHN